MPDRHRLAELVEAADLNELLRAVDGLCSERAWDDLVDLAERCEAAVERGKQLWPIAEHIDFRIALEAPGEYAADVLTESTGRFAPGPLTEVAASTHPWSELADHIESPQLAAYVAQERVLRSEVLDGDPRAHPEVLELPLHLEPWEPAYALATYAPDHVETMEPWTPKDTLAEVERGPGNEIDRPDIAAVLLDLVQPWVTESNGAARVAVTDSDAVGAASVLALDMLRIGTLQLDEAMHRIAWAAASGGAHGRRRGAALGRFMAWYTVCTCEGADWPPPEGFEPSDRVGWFYWDEGEIEKGWVLRIAIEHATEGWSAALGATDLLDEDEDEEGT